MALPSSESPLWSLVRGRLTSGSRDAPLTNAARPRRQPTATLPSIPAREAAPVPLPTVSVDGLLLFIGDTNIFPALSFEVSGDGTHGTEHRCLGIPFVLCSRLSQLRNDSQVGLVPCNVSKGVMAGGIVGENKIPSSSKLCITLTSFTLPSARTLLPRRKRRLRVAQRLLPKSIHRVIRKGIKLVTLEKTGKSTARLGWTRMASSECVSSFCAKTSWLRCGLHNGSLTPVSHV